MPETVVKDSSQREMERKAEELERKIVRFTNIDHESFTHSYRGVSITVGAGENYPMRLPEADHLATHLARKILAREKKKVTPKDRGVNLWNIQEVDELKGKILSPLGEEASPATMSPEQARKFDQDKLQKEFGPKPTSKKVSAPKVTRKQLIEDLESRGLKVDPASTNEQLQEQILQAEADGVTPKGNE